MSSTFQKTLAIISANLLRQTESTLKNSNLAIFQKKRVHRLRSHQIHQFLHQSGSVDDKDLKSVLTTGRFDVLIIGGKDAVTTWLQLIGQVDRGQANQLNVLYGSRDVAAAGRDVAFFFPGEQAVEYDLGSSQEFLEGAVKATLLKALVSMSKEKPPTPLIWLANWLLENRPHEI